MEDCVFCKINKGEIPATIVYHDDDFMVIKDINPQAKIHLVAIPSIHVPTIDLLTDEGVNLIGEIFAKISHMQKELGIEDGYRLVINQGKNAGQTVNHIHIHILGGEKLKDF